MDYNQLKKYNFKSSRQQELNKIAEEIHEFWYEVHIDNKARQIEEGLDVITSMFNYLNKLGMTNLDFKKHIDKLDGYKKIKYNR